ncbi:cation:proton antiporter [uncultured Ruminococcus sp.]|uniref:cation:proton antiporter n=1 Tax=Ruminococcus flavefaciens TaxID=1265 RepID=UPI00344DA385
MLLSLAIIILLGLSVAAIVDKIGLPRIIGMLGVGIIISPYVLDLLDPKILGISSELRQIALIIILVKAGLSLNLSDLKRVGRPAVMMSFVPACCEIIGYVVFAPLLLGVNRVEAAVMGAVLSAVSPAVVVPRMVKLIEEKCGTQKSIPQMILAGASCDDIFVIVLFSTFVTMAQGGSARMADFLNIPVSIVLGILLGAIAGYCIYLLFEKSYQHHFMIRNSTKVIILLGVSFLLMSVETLVKPYVAVSGLLAVVAAACIIKLKSVNSVSARLSEKFGKLWIGAEVMLFVLVGAAVDVRYTLSAGGAAVLMIFIALIFRAVGVFLCLLGTDLNAKERLFCIIAYLPKATVQAAIGSEFL